MDFELSPELEDPRRRVGEFVAREVMPWEDDPEAFDDHENLRESVAAELREKAKAKALWAFQRPLAYRRRANGIDVRDDGVG